jgi:hypothetical protein
MVGGSVDVTTWNSVTVVIPTERKCLFKHTVSRDFKPTFFLYHIKDNDHAAWQQLKR